MFLFDNATNLEHSTGFGQAGGFLDAHNIEIGHLMGVGYVAEGSGIKI